MLGWSSRQLKFVCDSTCYAETAQGSRATKEVMFFKQALIAVNPSRSTDGPPVVCHACYRATLLFGAP